jgi:hypothetical protein
MQSPIGGYLKRVPRKVWIRLGIILAIILAVVAVAIWHGHKVKAMKAEAYASGWQAAVDQGKKTNIVINKGSAQIANKHRSEFNAKLGNSSRLADAVRLSGPGRASVPACLHPQLPASSGGQDAGSGDVGLGVVGMSDEARQRFVALPFDQTVDRFQTDDANRLEASQWRKWHTEFETWWAEMQTKAENAPKKK